MPDSLQWLRDDARLILQGELDQETVAALWEQRESAMNGVNIVDLNALVRVDTSGLALLLHLVNIGQQNGKSISLEGVSDKVMTLAQLYNLPGTLMPIPVA